LQARHQVDRTSSVPISHQISNALRSQISLGEIAADTRLVSTRAFAIELGVSRSTVVEAYEQLVAEAYVFSRPGAGYFAANVARSEPVLHKTVTTFAGHEKNVEEQMHKFRPPGRPDISLFPHAKWARHVARIARTDPFATIAHEHSFGDTGLRTAITRYLEEWRGLQTSARNIVITTGSLEGLELCFRFLLKPQNTVGLEDPGYPPLRELAVRSNLNVHWLRVGDGGPGLPSSKGVKFADPKAIVLTPSNQYPLGGVISPSRRKEFVDWSESTGGWIIEDDYDSEYRFAGHPVLPMASTNNAQRIIYLGTFNKTLSPGLRIGFMAIPDELVEVFQNALQTSGTRASAIGQRPLAAFIESGDMLRHLRRTRRIYGERRAHLVGLIKNDLSEHLAFNDYHSGMQLTVKFRGAHDDREVYSTLPDLAGFCAPLSDHFSFTNPQNGLLLGFCSNVEEELSRNVAQLKNILTDSV
jgi:GntR family transcriptional regulator/MocR family aminotransferase